jgi:hypothetical protein
MVITRIRPLSCAKIAGTLYAMMGLLLGAFISLIALTGGFASKVPAAQGFVSMIGASAIVVMPILYGGLGFVMTLVSAAVYNFAAGLVGGIEIETS